MKRNWKKYDTPKEENYGISRQLLNWYKRNKGLNTAEEVAEYQNEKHWLNKQYKQKITRKWSKLDFERHPTLYKKNLEYRLQHGITYSGIMTYKWRYGLATIEEALEHREKNIRKIDKRLFESDVFNADYSKMQRKINQLQSMFHDKPQEFERLKTDLQNEYISIYGKLPI